MPENADIVRKKRTAAKGYRQKHAQRTNLVAIRAVVAPRASPLVTEHGSGDGARGTAHRVGAHALRPAVPCGCTEAALLLEVAPSLHRDLGAVELAVFVVAALVGACDGACGLSRVSPTEVIEVPEGVGGEDEVPNRQRKEVDQHPEDVDNAMRGDDDEDTR